MRVKEVSEKAGLKLNVQKTKIMASGPITSWHIEGEKVEAVKDFFSPPLGSKITADCDCSHEIERHLLLGRKAMANLDNILKRREMTMQEDNRVNLQCKNQMKSLSRVRLFTIRTVAHQTPRSMGFSRHKYHSSKASIFRHSAFFTVQLSHL